MTDSAWFAIIVLALIAAITISYVVYRVTGADEPGARYRCDRCTSDGDDDDDDDDGHEQR